MIVLSVNAGAGEARLTSLMRDIWVNVPGHGGAMDRFDSSVFVFAALYAEIVVTAAIIGG